MNDTEPADCPVGYGKPPVEHRFKSGQKRPARKAKPAAAASEPARYADLLRRLLMEPVQVTLNGQTKWTPTFELLIRRLIERAPKNAGSMRLLHEFQRFLDDGLPGPDVMPEVWIDGVKMSTR